MKCTYPVGHLLHPQTKYVNAACTDVRATFRRWREQQQKQVVVPIKRKEQA